MLPFVNTIEVIEERNNSQHHSHDVLEAFMTAEEELRVISMVSSVTYWSLHDFQSAPFKSERVCLLSEENDRDNSEM